MFFTDLIFSEKKNTRLAEQNVMMDSVRISILALQIFVMDRNQALLELSPDNLSPPPPKKEILQFRIVVI